MANSYHERRAPALGANPARGRARGLEQLVGDAGDPRGDLLISPIGLLDLLDRFPGYIVYIDVSCIPISCISMALPLNFRINFSESETQGLDAWSAGDL